MRFSAVVLSLAALVFASCCNAQPEPTAAASSASAAAPVQFAELYVFNDSGRTLVPGNQVVTDNGQKVASLPRQTFVKLQVAPGAHVLKPDPPLWKQQVSLNVAAGNRYYVVVAYKPERSWALPLGGAPLVLREVTAEEAAPLMREMKPQ